MKDEKEYLHQSWQQCLDQHIVLPTNTLRIFDAAQERVRYLSTGFLANEEDPDEDMQSEEGQDWHEADLHEEEQHKEEEVLAMTPADTEIPAINEDEVLAMTPADEEFPTINEDDVLATTTAEKVTTISEDKDLAKTHAADSVKNSSNPDNRASSSKDRTDDYEVMTQHAKAVGVVLGLTDEVKEFDRRHLELKRCSSERVRAKLKDEYMHILAQIQVKVLAANGKAQKKLHQWEQEYVMQNKLRSPSYEAMKADPTASTLMKQIKHSEALLKH